MTAHPSAGIPTREEIERYIGNPMASHHVGSRMARYCLALLDERDGLLSAVVQYEGTQFASLLREVAILRAQLTERTTERDASRDSALREAAAAIGEIRYMDGTVPAPVCDAVARIDALRSSRPLLVEEGAFTVNRSAKP